MDSGRTYERKSCASKDVENCCPGEDRDFGE